jgi:hypothetical protein
MYPHSGQVETAWKQMDGHKNSALAYTPGLRGLRRIRQLESNLADTIAYTPCREISETPC